MKEVKLTDRDYRDIKTAAHHEWMSKSISHTNPEEFVCRCYVNALLSFCNAKGYVLIDGKLYVK